MIDPPFSNSSVRVPLMKGAGPRSRGLLWIGARRAVPVSRLFSGCERLERCALRAGAGSARASPPTRFRFRCPREAMASRPRRRLRRSHRGPRLPSHRRRRRPVSRPASSSADRRRRRRSRGGHPAPPDRRRRAGSTQLDGSSPSRDPSGPAPTRCPDRRSATGPRKPRGPRGQGRPHTQLPQRRRRARRPAATALGRVDSSTV